METLIWGAIVYLLAGAAAHAASRISGDDENSWGLAGVLALAGAILGIGRLLASDSKLTLRLMAGRAIVAGGLAVGAGSLLAFFTNLHVLALCGFAAVCAVLGEQFLEKVINERLSK
jgi:hypothetical protein